jgi:hypothetical protein
VEATMAGEGSAVQQFFSEFQRKGNLNDPGPAAGLFAATFLVAGPEGVRPVARGQFEPALRRRKEWLASLGAAGAELVWLEETWLDRRYVLASTQWRMSFGADREVEVASTYLVDMGGPAPAIVVYLAHQDLMAVLREKGIVR